MINITLPTTSRRQAKSIIDKHAETTGVRCQGGNASHDRVVSMEINDDNSVTVHAGALSSTITLAEWGCFSKKWEKYIKEQA